MIDFSLILGYYEPTPMDELLQVLSTQTFAYVTRDLERALGLFPIPAGYVIVTNASDFAKQYAKEHNQVFLIADDRLLDTHELLAHEQTIAVFDEHNITQVLVFKNTKRIEQICQQHNWTLLNPSATLAAQVEEKISQVQWLDELAHYLPPFTIDELQHIAFNGEPFIMQFNRAHTGSGTLLIESKAQLQKLQEQFPKRPVKVSAYINGYTLTSNNIIGESAILLGNISYQITGLPPFTTEAFSTIGNDFALPQQLLNYAQQSRCKEIAHAIAKKLQSQGWRGAFGVDLIIDEQSTEVYLLEINARQPASVSFESFLQSKHASKQAQAVTTFEAHVAALLGIPLNKKDIIPITDGAQIILRYHDSVVPHLTEIKQALEKDYRLFSYQNSSPNSDILRIQSETSLMQAHAQLNTQGNHIAHIINEQLK